MSARDEERLHEELSALVDGALPEPRASELRREVDADPELARELEALRRTRALVRGLARHRAPPELRARIDEALPPPARRGARIYALLAVASAVAAGALLAVLPWGDRGASVVETAEHDPTPPSNARGLETDDGSGPDTDKAKEVGALVPEADGARRARETTAREQPPDREDLERAARDARDAQDAYAESKLEEARGAPDGDADDRGAGQEKAAPEPARQTPETPAPPAADPGAAKSGDLRKSELGASAAAGDETKAGKRGGPAPADGAASSKEGAARSRLLRLVEDGAVRLDPGTSEEYLAALEGLDDKAFRMHADRLGRREGLSFGGPTTPSGPTPGRVGVGGGAGAGTAGKADAESDAEAADSGGGAGGGSAPMLEAGAKSQPADELTLANVTTVPFPDARTARRVARLLLRHYAPKPVAVDRAKKARAAPGVRNSEFVSDDKDGLTIELEGTPEELAAALALVRQLRGERPQSRPRPTEVHLEGRRKERSNAAGDRERADAVEPRRRLRLRFEYREAPRAATRPREREDK